MRAVRSNPPGVTVVDVDEPEGPGELVQIRSASICSSDFAYIDYGSTSILGHELAGVTEDGRAVSVEAIFGCGECEFCLSGRYNLCPTTGTTQQLGNGVDGGMSEWFRVPSSKLVALPDGLSPADACLVEPLAVALHGCHLVDVGPESQGRGRRRRRRRAVRGRGRALHWARPRSRSRRVIRTRSRRENDWARRNRPVATTSCSKPPAPRARSSARSPWSRGVGRWACSACASPVRNGRTGVGS